MEQTNADGLSEAAILTQVDRICDSSGFRQSGRLSQFLRYIVKQTLAGQADSLKEYAIGVEVYGRKASYNPSQDSIVRTEARRLRHKLKDYYDQEAGAEVLVYLRVGTYRPVFQKYRKPDAAYPSPGLAASVDNRRPEDSPGYAIAVSPFADNSCTPETSASAAGLTEEITYRISLTEGCRAMTLDSEHAWGDPLDNLSAARRDPKVQQIIYGSVQKQGSQFAILVHGRNPRSREVWTEKFQAEPRDGELLKLQKYAASALMARIRPHRSEIRNMEEQVDPTCVAMYPEILSAEALLDTCDPVAIKAALNRLRGLVARSPNSARSFCGIVQCHYLLALLHEPVLAEAMRESRRCAQRALEMTIAWGRHMRL